MHVHSRSKWFIYSAASPVTAEIAAKAEIPALTLAAGASGNAELRHARLKRAAFQPEQGRRAFRASDHSVRRAKRLQNVPPLGVGHGRDGRNRGAIESRLERVARDIKPPASGENHAALQYVAQFADIAGPGIIFQGLHRLRGDGIDLLAHARGELLDQ